MKFFKIKNLDGVRALKYLSLRKNEFFFKEWRIWEFKGSGSVGILKARDLHTAHDFMP